MRGPADASVTLVEYGDFECPYCGRAEPVVRELLTDADLRYVWRHLPLTDVHPRAQLAAEAAEAAGPRAGSGRCTTCCSPVRTPAVRDLLGYAGELGLDPDRFHADLMPAVHRRVAARRRVGRPERGVRHADVLRQRPAALRRVRHRCPDPGHPHRPGPGPGRGREHRHNPGGAAGRRMMVRWW